MPKITITIEDLPAGDERGTITALIRSDPPITPEQDNGTAPVSQAQQLGAMLANHVVKLMNPPPANGPVIDVAAGKDGALAPVVELKEGVPHATD